MTIREVLVWRRRKLLLLGVAGPFGLLMLISREGQHVVPWLAVAFLLLYGLVVITTSHWFNCPRCGGSLGILKKSLIRGGNSLDRTITQCPNCGVSLDEQWNDAR